MTADSLDLERAARCLSNASAEQIVTWADNVFGDGLVLSTSFGIQSAVLLHLATRVRPDIPVVWVDTGYLPEETYHYAERLQSELGLNLVVAQSDMSPARMEALHGRLWEHNDLAAIDLYDRIRKVEPMKRALDDLGATAWMAGLRSDQTDHRRGLAPVAKHGGRFKVHPILAWNARDIYGYMKRHDLPQHPLFDQGYATVGDWHSSRPVGAEESNVRDTRFGGRKQECGLHLDDDQAASLESSGL
jgi:phosphoadenosine phosphosulfate reductase